jgi:transcriptional antiterminator RfaH
MLNTISPLNNSATLTAPNGSASWFCVRTQPKHEHIAEAHLARTGQVTVFHPRIRFSRPTRRGPVTVVESLFPNYLFARFDWDQCLNLVQYTSGVSGVVHFGSNWPTLPDSAIDNLRSLFGTESVRWIPSAPEVGETVLLCNGVFEGLDAVVTRVLPGGQRVAVLLHILGRQSSVEVKTADVIRNTHEQMGRTLSLLSRDDAQADQKVVSSH